MPKNVGFIGAGYMGYGIAKNLLKNNFNLKIIAHKNRKPIERLVSKGAKEVKNYSDLTENINCLFMCVSNTPIAKDIAKEIYLNIPKKTLVIDITTHNKNGSIEMKDIFSKNEIKYVESPVMGGPVQAEQGILGGIVGASDQDYNLAKIYLDSFCKEHFYFGPVGLAAKAKLICNFLSLGTTTFVIETIKAAEKYNIDFKKYVENFSKVDFSDNYFQASGVGKSRIKKILFIANNFSSTSDLKDIDATNVSRILASAGD